MGPAAAAEPTQSLGEASDMRPTTGLRRTVTRSILAIVALCLMALVAVPSAAQSPSPTPAPNVTPGPGGSIPGVLRWAPVGPPWLHADRRLHHPVAWAGGFAVLEEWEDGDQELATPTRCGALPMGTTGRELDCRRG